MEADWAPKSDGILLTEKAVGYLTYRRPWKTSYVPLVLEINYRRT